MHIFNESRRDLFQRIIKLVRENIEKAKIHEIKNVRNLNERKILRIFNSQKHIKEFKPYKQYLKIKKLASPKNNIIVKQ